MNEIYHKSVLVNEVLEYLNPQPNKIYVDVTFGGGGHTRAISQSEPKCKVIAIDWDNVAIEKNGPELQEEFGDRIKLIWGNFAQIVYLLKKEGISKVDGILADFGTSQYQITKRPGFSFSRSTPLDMRMSPGHQKVTAQDIINKASEAELIKIFKDYGEEPFARRIAKAICLERKKKRFDDTLQLAELVKKTVPQINKKIHPATKVFQALRIAVNKELEQIKALLHHSIQLLNPEGRIVCISFHSLEDRIVKQFFKEHEQELKNLTQKVVTATEEEIKKNPSSRSAKLRAAEKI
ncbi:16S rRNA (cytosine(1402)-N(4))-methyltransferase RsmH [Candidatus Dependentiae bacterium]|nr:16S rRNA (cytosine(1402)-N(4))-methyltransferase RsmH [Candidatus Dependentiae bacterium]